MNEEKINVPHINKIIFSGRLTAEPESTTTQSGTSMATFTLAVDTPKRNSDNTGWDDPETLFIRITTFSNLAEKVTKRLKKGSPAIVEGRLRSYKYNLPNSEETRTGYSVNASRVHPLVRYFVPSNASDNQIDEVNNIQNNDDDIPF